MYFLNEHIYHPPDTAHYICFDKHLGWRHKPFFSETNKGNFTSTDSSGLRNIPYTSTPGAHRKILFIGDSFTEGAEVSDSNSFPAQLQKIRNDLKILNGGVIGYSHGQMLLLLRERITLLKPDVVVLGFVYDDISRNQLTFNGFAKPGFSSVNSSLVLKNPVIPSPKEILNEKRCFSAALLFIEFLFSKKVIYMKEDDIALTRLLIWAMHNECSKNNAKFKVLMIPQTGEPDKNAEKVFSEFENYFRERHISFFSLGNSLNKTYGIKSDIMPGRHWGQNANRFIAAQICCSGFID